MTAKNEDGDTVSLVYSKCDESECKELDDDELAGLLIDFGVLSEDVLIADLTASDELTSISTTQLAAIDPTIFPTVALEEPVEDDTCTNAGLAPKDTSFLPTTDAPGVNNELGKSSLTESISKLAPEVPSVPLISTPEVEDNGNAKSKTVVASKPLGSLWTFDDHYPNAGLVRCSCHLASRPWPNYCM